MLHAGFAERELSITYGFPLILIYNHNNPHLIEDHIGCCRIELGVSFDDLIYRFKEVFLRRQFSPSPAKLMT